MSSFIDIIPAISQLLDRIIPDPAARERAKAELVNAERAHELEEFRAALAADQSQHTINSVEAASTDRFVAGWRPFIGWVCGIAFAYHFVLQPFLAFVMLNSGHAARLPAFDMQTLSSVLMGMLGLGGLRTIEKIKNVSR